MNIIPVLLDARPPYLGADDAASSLLLLPTGVGTVLSEVVERVATVTSYMPFVLPHFAPGPRYLEAVRREEPGLSGIVGRDTLRDPLSRFDPADTLLLISAECYPIDGIDLDPLVGARVNDARMLRHLLAFETATLGAKEFVQSGADGRLRRVQRYFEPVTWPFPAGIVASLVPVSCLLTAAEAPSTSLAELRTALSAQGAAGQDVPCHGRFVDLTDEPGALALAERRLLRLVDDAARHEAAAATRPVVLSQNIRIDPSARFIGPVVVASGACVEADALVVGPALLGRGAHVGHGATVAQSLLIAGARVGDGESVRHRVVTDVAVGRGHTSEVQQRRQRYGSTSLPTPAPRRGGYLAVKAAVEPVIAGLLLLMLSPLFLLFAILIVIDSGLPVFYGDRREGQGGAPFRCWKFRSMLANADAMQRALAAAQQLDGPQFKMDRDPRVTRVGRWLRRLNVDELPQLWNVLRGQMSFVGPRPSPFRENQICVPWRHGRLSVRPGITGLWQVCRHDRAAGDFHQWIHYDLLYVRHVSFAVDLRIFAATLLTGGGRRPTRLDRILPGARGHTPLGGAAERPVVRADGARPWRPAATPTDALPALPTPTRPLRARVSGPVRRARNPRRS